MENPNPIVYESHPQQVTKQSTTKVRRVLPLTLFGDDPRSMPSSSLDEVDPFDAEEVFELVRHINDPEHPLTLEQLRVTQLELITVDNDNSTVDIQFTPTIPHCSMATMIGLCLRVKLLRSLPQRFKVRVSITPGKHAQEHQGMLVHRPLVMCLLYLLSYYNSIICHLVHITYTLESISLSFLFYFLSF